LVEIWAVGVLQITSLSLCAIAARAYLWHISAGSSFDMTHRSVASFNTVWHELYRLDCATVALGVFHCPVLQESTHGLVDARTEESPSDRMSRVERERERERESRAHCTRVCLALTPHSCVSYSHSCVLCHCNTLQHTVTHCNTLQHTATHCNTLQHTATHSCVLCILLATHLCDLCCTRTEESHDLLYYR